MIHKTNFAEDTADSLFQTVGSYSWSRKSSSISHPLARTISCVTEWRGINCPVVSATFWKALQGPFWKKQGTDNYTPNNIMYTVWHKNKPFCMLMLHSNRSSKVEVFSVSGPWGEGLTKIICFLFTLSLKCSTQNFQITTSSCEIRCCQTDQSHTKLWRLPRWHLEDGR